MITNQTIEIKEGGVRLDAALLHAVPSTTRAFVKEAIASGGVLIAEAGAAPRRAPKGLKLRGGERIVVRELLEAKTPRTARVETAPSRGLFLWKVFY